MTESFKSVDIKGQELLIEKDQTIVIRIDSDLNIKYRIKDADVKIVYIVDTEKAIDFHEQGEIFGGRLQILFYDLTPSLLHQRSLLTNKKGELSLTTKYLVRSKKDVVIECVNEESNTIVNIDNSCVILDDGDLLLECTGKILKGAKQSSSHQKSRSLVYGSPQRVKIDPVLLIEESDVEASHALSSGTIDEDVLYYMNSRGLSKDASLKLLINSYLLPNDDTLKDVEGKEAILKRLMERVDDL